VIDSLQQRYRDKHPELIQARALMADLLQKFDLELKKVLANSKDEEAYWESNDASLTDTSWDTHVASELKLVEARTNVLQREVDTESALFDNVLKQMREADVSDKSAPTEIRMVEPPLLPLVPSAPHKKIILMIAGLFGIFIGVALVLLLNALDNSVKTATEAEELFHLPVLATIPRLSRSEKKKRVSCC
jgi:succinoglycan biosynthesis transport protein ExoP